MFDAVVTEEQKRLFNLRKELSRHIWDARHGCIDTLVANENTRDLVALCPDTHIEAADRLQHKVMSQITVIAGRLYLRARGAEVERFVAPVKTRLIAWQGRMPAGMIG